MPQIPLPPSANPGSQQARSIPESTVQATPDAFGANIAEAQYRGARAVMGATEQAARAEAGMWNTAMRGITNLVGEQLQKDWKLDAEAKLNDLKLGIERDDENLSPTGDGSTARRGIEAFDAQANKLIDGAASPFQANILRDGIQRLRFQRESALVAREASALRQTRVDNANKIVEGAEVEIFRDPGQLPAIQERTIASINESALTSSQKSKLIEQTNKRFYSIALEKHLVDGNIGAAQKILEDDAAIGSLGALDSVRAQARVNKAAEDAAEKSEAVAFQQRLLSGEQAIDPQDAAQRKIVDKAFTATGGDRLLAESDPNAPVHIASIAKRYGVVPSSAITILNGMALSGDSEQKAYALQTVNMIETARPGAFEVSGSHKRIRSEAEDFHFLTSGSQGLGLEPSDAIRRIDEKRTPEFQAKAEARKSELSGAKGLTVKRTEAELAAAFDEGIFYATPEVGNPRDRAVILNTYRKAFNDHYIRTGDEDMAVAAAQKDLRRQFGVSRLSGDGSARLVRNPIEYRLPAIDGSHDWVKTQAVEVIKEQTGKAVEPENVFFESTRATDEALSRGGIAAGHVPPYAVYWLDTDANGNRAYQTIAGKLFLPDFAKAQRGAVDAASAERSKNAGTSAPSVSSTEMPSVSQERQTSAADMERTERKAQAAERAKQSAPTISPEREDVEDAATSLIDIFGFAAKGGN